VVQFLEGPLAAVRKIFINILKDWRHECIRICRCEITPARKYHHFKALCRDDALLLSCDEDTVHYITGLSPDLVRLSRGTKEECGEQKEDAEGEEDATLVTITYFSRMKGDRHSCVKEIRKISEEAEEVNRARGITGLLTYEEQTKKVTQILEGPRESITLMLELIKADPRHAVDEVTDPVNVTSRQYAGWSMMLMFTQAHRRNAHILDAAAKQDMSLANRLIDNQLRNSPFRNHLSTFGKDPEADMWAPDPHP